MTKKSSRGRKQKRSVEPQKVEKCREEVARELGVELPEKEKEKKKKKVPPGNTSSYRLDDR